VANLALFSVHESLGISQWHAVRISLFAAGAWWALFALILLRTLRNRSSGYVDEQDASVITAGFRQLLETLRDATTYPQTLLFLAAYLLYNDGIQTVIALASTYGGVELGLEDDGALYDRFRSGVGRAGRVRGSASQRALLR
jgi:UMF1 family MFS transporter